MPQTVSLDLSALTRARGLLASLRVEDAQAALGPLADSLATDEAPPTPRHFWRDAADLLRDAGLFDASLAAWQRARSAGLDADVAAMQAGVTLLAAGRFAEARAALAARAAAEPHNATLAHLHATALLESGSPAEALAHWQTAGRLACRTEAPLDTHPLYLALSIAALERLVAAAPTSVTGTCQPGRAPGGSARRRLGRIAAAAEAGRLAQALAWIEAELADGPPTEGDLRQMRAWLLLEEGRAAEARTEAARLAAAQPGEPMLLSLFALCLARTGQAQWALRVLEYVQPEGPDDYFGHYHAGVAHLALGDRVRALLCLRRAFDAFFYDTYHSLVPPLWRRARALMAAAPSPAGSPPAAACAVASEGSP